MRQAKLELDISEVIFSQFVFLKILGKVGVTFTPTLFFVLFGGGKYLRCLKKLRYKTLKKGGHLREKTGKKLIMCLSIKCEVIPTPSQLTN